MNVFDDKPNDGTNVLGSGAARRAADTIKLKNEWKRQYAMGETTLSWKDWLAQQGHTQTTLAQ